MHKALSIDFYVLYLNFIQIHVARSATTEPLLRSELYLILL